jgi:serine/threonine protein kinase
MPEAATPRNYGWDGQPTSRGSTSQSRRPGTGSILPSSEPKELVNVQTQSERAKSRQNWSNTASVNQFYSIGRTIGEGTFGKVKKGIHKLTGLTVAIKILEKERIIDLADVQRVKREIAILQRLSHPNVIQLYEVIDSPRHIYLVMDFAPNGELFEYIVKHGKVKERRACR